MNKKSLISLTVLVGVLVVLVMLWTSLKKPSPEVIEKKEEIKSVTMVTDVGGLGDQSFNDAGWKGVQMASKGLGLEANVIQSRKGEDLVANVSRAAESADIVVGLGFMIKDAIIENASLYPDTYFILIDEDAGDLPNVASYLFYTGESGYLAGIISASVTKTGKVGIVKGMDIPPVLTYVAGFEAGVKTWNEAMEKEVKVFSRIADSFTDSAKGKALTKELLAEGADIVFDVAGGTGLGVYEAIQEANLVAGITEEQITIGSKMPKYFAVGVDVDHDEMFPGEVLVSALKKMPETIYSAIEDIMGDNFKSGLHRVDFKEGATGISEMKYTKQYVSEKALELVKKAKESMLKRDERLRVPLDIIDVAEYVENFQVPEELLKVE
ncbi:MAG: BMP family ABC transporter substrate-binding protein [bacterium]|nr:BMP family ABC transporter substrate-binding protein [bacterium]